MVQNNTAVSMTFKNKITNLDKLKEYEDRLKNIKKIMKDMPSELILTNTNSTAKDTTKSLATTNKQLKNTSQLINAGFKATSIIAFGKAISSVTEKMQKYTAKSSDYIENLNLTDVAFQGATEEGRKFINMMSDMYGLDESSVTRTVGLFKQLSNAMGLSNEIGTTLSKTMTLLANDISSLYNTSFERATSVLESALAGQTAPIRRLTGADITQATLQVTLDTYGIDTTVSQLSYLEKRLLIVTSLINQLDEAQNDYGRTIESVANQQRIFEQQIQRISRAFGNVFIPILAEVLPYLNGVLMALTEIINFIASLLGFKEEDFNYFGETSDSVSDLNNNLISAGDSAKKLKQGLRGFDKLNVITTPTSSGGGVGNAGINPDLLNLANQAMLDYQNTMEKVRMKANDIRDSIMEWLGFTKEVDPLTGKVSYKYEGLQKTLKNMWNSFEGLSATGKVFVGLGIAGTFLNMLSTGKKLTKVLGKGTGLGGIIGWMINPTKNLFGTMLTGIKSSHSSLKSSIQSWREQQGIINSTTGKIDGFKGAMKGLNTILSGLTIGVTSFAILKDSLQNATEEGWNFANVLGTIGGNLGIIASGVQIGAVFGPWGAAIGGVTSALIGLYTTYSNMPTEVTRTNEAIRKSNEEINKYLDSVAKQNQYIDDTLRSNLLLIDSHEKMVDSLEKIVDENGKIQRGHEAEAQFIVNTLNNAYGLNIEIQNGVIEKYDEQIERISEVIEKKKAEAILEANKEKYVQALQDEVRLYDEMNEATSNYNEAQSNLNKAQQEYNEMIDYIGKHPIKSQFKYSLADIRKIEKAVEDTTEEVEKSKKTQERATQAYVENVETQNKYSELNKAVVTGNLSEINEATEKYVNSYEKDGETIVKTDEEVAERRAYNWKLSLEDYKVNNKERYDELIDALTKETQAIEDLTPEQVAKWKALAESDKEAFLTSFGSLNDDVQEQLVPKMQDSGLKLSESLQKGINKINPTINVKADTSSAEKSISKFLINVGQSGALAGLKVLNSFSTKANGGIYENGIWKNIPKYANGFSGLPPVGQLFVANEQGPELISHIGGKTYVENRNQIMDLIDSKIANANNKQPINATFIIQVGDEEVARKVIDNLEDKANANGKPYVIGG